MPNLMLVCFCFKNYKSGQTFSRCFPSITFTVSSNLSFYLFALLSSEGSPWKRTPDKNIKMPPFIDASALSFSLDFQSLSSQLPLSVVLITFFTDSYHNDWRDSFAPDVFSTALLRKLFILPIVWCFSTLTFLSLLFSNYPQLCFGSFSC